MLVPLFISCGGHKKRAMIAARARFPDTRRRDVSRPSGDEGPGGFLRAFGGMSVCALSVNESGGGVPRVGKTAAAASCAPRVVAPPLPEPLVPSPVCLNLGGDGLVEI